MMGKLFGKPKSPPMSKPVVLPAYVPPPAPEPVVQAPSEVVDQAAIEAKKKKEKLAMSQKSGRASTFLTEDDGALG